MGYYLIITFIIFILVDYKYIYSYIDSKFLYTKSGSKLSKEIDNSNNKYTFISWDKLDIYIIFISTLILFLISYTISTIAFNMNPLTIKIIKKINLKVLMQGYEIKVRFIYHITALVYIAILNIKYIEKTKGVLQRVFSKILTQNSEKTVKICEGYIIAKDENDEVLQINDNSLYKNVLITGSIGSGKTTGAISRLAYNLIKSGKGGLILDVKGNFVETIEQMCKRTGREKDLCVVSTNSNSYFELMDENISALELANRLKQIITLLSINNNSDSYWLDKVENVLMNLIIIMKYLGNLNLMTLHRLVSEETFLKSSIKEVKEKLKTQIPDDKTAFELTSAISFVENEFAKLDIKVNSIIKSEITRLTIPLVTDYDIYNQFCVQGGKQKITFENNKIIVLSINIGCNKSLAKIMATFLKLSYQKYILSNISYNTPSFFIADEFQEFCNLEDAYFLSLSREARCINIISTQSYSSLRNALKDENTTKVIIQNLVNKIWFRNDDNYTTYEIIKQLGKREVIKENKTISESGQESKKNLFGTGFINKKSSISKSLNFVQTKENEYDENFFTRELNTFEALVFISTQSGVIIKKAIFERWK